MDSDLGFVFWLGHLLDAAGYSAYPAKTPADAMLLIRQLDLTVALLVIDPDLPESGDLVSMLHGARQDMKVIGVFGGPQQQGGGQWVGMDAHLLRPSVFDKATNAEWLSCVEQLLHQPSRRAFK